MNNNSWNNVPRYFIFLHFRRLEHIFNQHILVKIINKKRVFSLKNLKFSKNFIILLLWFFFQVCHGKGSSREASQTDAARRALVLLADSGDIDEDATDEIETGNGIGADDSIPVVSAAAAENND